uniref:Uncharacterized protein n=1 Tax=Branchiostoma floridae TaxID=7739 RepID=C3XRY8_BRAFL|eukprot:XP_002613447.1 hypothetical protein BRAFLDRAFT_123924 [Branchiostoma floridae]
MYNRATGTSSGSQGTVSVNIPAENVDKTLPDVVPDKGSGPQGVWVSTLFLLVLYERFEVLAVFTSTTLAQLGQLFVVKERGRLLVGTAFGFAVHFVSTYFVTNKAFQHVSEASSSSWLQEHVADISRSLCSVIPGLSTLLLPRINPLPLIAVAGALALFITDMLIEINNYFRADTFAAISIAIMTVGTMFPMSVYSGRILLQASTLDGVLEFRNEHFWTVSFGTLAGSLHVRIRRDANEQMVLAHVTNRLSNLVTVLTIHIFKDDWTRASLSSSSYAPRQPYTSTPAKPGLDSSVPAINPFQSLPPLAPNLSTITPIGSPAGPSLHQPGTRLYGTGTTAPSHMTLGPAANTGGRIPLRTYQPTDLFGASGGAGQKSTTEHGHSHSHR